MGYDFAMASAAQILFKTLADPTRRALFERLAKEGEHTVHALTERAGVTQPAVSKHLRILKLAGLVSERRDGRETHYRAHAQAILPLSDWIGVYGGTTLIASSLRFSAPM
jgi:DNA-binding transcriptional ArsR family regulator